MKQVERALYTTERKTQHRAYQRLQLYWLERTYGIHSRRQKREHRSTKMHTDYTVSSQICQTSFDKLKSCRIVTVVTKYTKTVSLFDLYDARPSLLFVQFHVFVIVFHLSVAVNANKPARKQNAGHSSR